MPQETHYRIKVRAGMSLRQGWISVDPLPLQPARGFVNLWPHIPTEMPLDFLPPNLRVIGSVFWMVFKVDREPVGFERVDGGR